MPDNEPRWVELLCRIAPLWQGSGKSIHRLFEEVTPDLQNLSRLRSLAGAYLAAHPELADAWEDYSRDKRTASGPWLDGKRVGFFDGRYNQDVRRYHDRVRACADYVCREALSVLAKPDPAAVAYERGSIYEGRRQYQRGYRVFATAARLYAESAGTNDPHAVAALAGQASCLVAAGDLASGAALYRDALDRKRRSGDKAWPTADELTELLRDANAGAQAGKTAGR